MNFCKSCNVNYDDEIKFCMKCGAQLVQQKQISPDARTKPSVMKEKLSKAPNAVKKKPRVVIKILLITVPVIIMLGFLGAYQIGIRIHKMPSSSMEPTIKAGDFIVTMPYHFSLSPRRFDIVQVQTPISNNPIFFLRIIALPNEQLMLSDKITNINGNKLSEPYVKHTDSKILSAKVAPRDNFGPFNVPVDSYFMMGDNRDQSYDCRFWRSVSGKSIIARVLFVF